MLRALVFFFLVLQCAALAHPVAQGAMDIFVAADAIEIHARVSCEEAFVAAAFGEKANAGTTLDDVWRRHGDYFLAHLALTADGLPLAGKVTALTPPANTAPEGRIAYDLRYDFPPGSARPRAITLQQNVLNEFTFAPGNAWEASYVIRLSQKDRPAQTERLLTSREPLTFNCDAAPPTGSMAGAFVRHGIMHILTSYDHLLFVAGLVLAVVSLMDLVKVVTAFTVAHTLTLTLATLDIVRLSTRIVEPMIAASIVFVALQNLLSPARSRGWTRLAVAFGFGLFHGLGFAGGLLDAMEGMSGVTIVTAIAAFSLGVEIGHQLVALPLFSVMKILRSASLRAPDPARLPRWAMRAGSSAICAAGLVYFVAALRQEP